MQRLKQLQQNKPLAVIIGTIMAVLLLLLIYLLIYFNGTSEAPQNIAEKTHQVGVSTEADSTGSSMNEEASTFSSNIQLINENVLNTKVSSDKTLAEDELATLNDIEQQLNEQKTLLEEQHQNADQLIALKEEQIAALEAQLQPQ